MLRSAMPLKGWKPIPERFCSISTTRVAKEGTTRGQISWNEQS